jgi:hypothetical protein
MASDCTSPGRLGTDNPRPSLRGRSPRCWESYLGLSEGRTRSLRKIADPTIFNQSKGKSGSYAHAALVGIEDPTIFNQLKGKSGSYAHAACVGMQNHSKVKSLLHLTSLK